MTSEQEMLEMQTNNNKYTFLNPTKKTFHKTNDKISSNRLPQRLINKID